MNTFTVLIVILAASFSQQNQIDQQSSSSKYWIPNFKANWFKANEYCQYNGLQLAVIDSAEAEAALYHAIRASDAYSPLSTRVWIGANDLADDGSFHWHATGKRIRYANWVAGQPDNWVGEEHCVEVGISRDEFKFTWQWNDCACKTMHYFACEDVAEWEWNKKITNYL